MVIIVLICTGLLGLCFGSFIHVAIYRFSPDKAALSYLYDIVFSRSKCVYCYHKLSYLSLIPIISWLIQRGQCRYCHQSIAINYLLVELVISIYCCVMISTYDCTPWTIILIFLGLYFIILAAIDFRYLLLPNYFTYPIMLTGLALSYVEINPIRLIDGGLGIICGYILLWVPAHLYYYFKKHSGLGGGDIKLLAALGTWIHYSQLPMLLVFASSIGILYVIFGAYFKKIPLKIVVIPFGPCLLISAYIILLQLANYHY